jgi:hypothetical protein
MYHPSLRLYSAVIAAQNRQYTSTRMANVPVRTQFAEHNTKPTVSRTSKGWDFRHNRSRRIYQSTLP